MIHFQFANIPFEKLLAIAKCVIYCLVAYLLPYILLVFVSSTFFYQKLQLNKLAKMISNQSGSRSFEFELSSIIYATAYTDVTYAGASFSSIIYSTIRQL